MNINDGIYGKCATESSGREDINFDVSLFLLRLLLFEKYTLNSIRFKELPIIAEMFGLDALKALLRTGDIQFHCEGFAIAQAGQNTIFRKSKGVLPLGSYFFETIQTVDDEHHYRLILNPILKQIKSLPSIRVKEIKGLEKLIRKKIVKHSDDTHKSLRDCFYRKLEDKYLLSEAIKSKLVEEGFSTPEHIDFHIFPIDKDDFKVESNIGSLYGVDELREHKIIERALLNVGGLEHRLLAMRDFQSLSGFNNEKELPLLDARLGAIAGRNTSKKIENNFQKVITLKGLPNFEEILESGNFDLHHFLEIRQTDECKAFRNWLWGIDKISEEEIQEKLNNLISKSGNLLSSTTGKILRFVANAGIGIASGGIGLATGALDTFLLDKFLKKDGVKAFVDKQYPQLYKG